MKPYPAYKGSGIEWLGEIPAEWEVEKLRYLADIFFSNVDKKTYDSETEILLCNYLDVYKNDFIVQNMDFMKGTATEEEINKFTIKKSDILLTKDSETPDDIAKPAFVRNDLPGIVCGYHLAIVRPNENRIKGEYLFRIFNAKSLNSHFFILARGITRFGLSTQSFKDFLVPTPPLPEQLAIAAFLDHKTRLIDTYIAKKQQQIERLLAYRTALINQAVTKGLNPDAPMKDSGIEWLGEIPAHWAIHSFRRIIKSIEQGWSPIAENRLASPTEWAVIKLNAVKKGVFQPEEHKVLPENIEINEHYKIKTGDFLVTRANTPNLVGDVCIAEEIPFNLLLSDLVYRISIEENKNDKKFLCYWFLSAGRHQIMSDARGSSQSMVKISQSHIRAWIIISPPLSEQNAIVSFLDTETAKIDTLIATTQRQIDRLQAYRTALISDAVTGKIDVRNYRDLT